MRFCSRGTCRSASLALGVVGLASTQVALYTQYSNLHPSQVTDPNGDRQAATYNALGLLEKVAIMGKANDSDGGRRPSSRKRSAAAKRQSFA